MATKPNLDPINQLLHRGDPLIDDPGLSSQESRRMRHSILACLHDKTARGWTGLSPALSVAVLLALALGIAWWPSSSTRSRSGLAPSGEVTLTHQSDGTKARSPGGGSALETRKIQFETPGGTLVVWTLNPNFPS